MTPIYSSLPSLEGNDHDQNLRLDFDPTSQTCSSTCRIFFSPEPEPKQGDPERTYHDRDHLHLQEQENEGDLQFSTHVPTEHNFLLPPSLPIVDEESKATKIALESSICKETDRFGDECDGGSVKWMSSKMRLMRKMMRSDPRITNKPSNSMQAFQNQHRSLTSCDYYNNSSSPNNKIRVCSDCNTTKTPLWRSGPQGPKSLCNACGIRQRKARRAMAAAASGGLLGVGTSVSTKKVRKKKRSEGDYPLPYKKRIKRESSPRPRKKLRFDEFTINLSKNSAFHQVFPLDEREAAILLMALSCGLVRG